MFKFHLGAAVVLITSVPALIEQRRQEEEDRQADRLAAEAGSSMLRPIARIRAFQQVERGVVTGRAEYARGEDGYLVRYRDGGGCQQQDWIGESGLVLESDLEGASRRARTAGAAAAEYEADFAEVGEPATRDAADTDKSCGNSESSVEHETSEPVINITTTWRDDGREVSRYISIPLRG